MEAPVHALRLLRGRVALTARRLQVTDGDENPHLDTTAATYGRPTVSRRAGEPSLSAPAAAANARGCADSPAFAAPCQAPRPPRDTRTPRFRKRVHTSREMVALQVAPEARAAAHPEPPGSQRAAARCLLPPALGRLAQPRARDVALQYGYVLLVAVASVFVLTWMGARPRCRTHCPEAARPRVAARKRERASRAASQRSKHRPEGASSQVSRSATHASGATRRRRARSAPELPVPPCFVPSRCAQLQREVPHHVCGRVRQGRRQVQLVRQRPRLPPGDGSRCGVPPRGRSYQRAHQNTLENYTQACARSRRERRGRAVHRGAARSRPCLSSCSRVRLLRRRRAVPVPPARGRPAGARCRRGRRSRHRSRRSSEAHEVQS